VSEETGQTIISGMGELHLEVLRDRMERDFGLKVRVHKPRVSYRETVRKSVVSEGKFNRQSAGETQFAKVSLRVEPFESEDSITLKNNLKPSDLPPELSKLLEEAVAMSAQGGGFLGYPLMNVKFTIVDCGYRQGETTELAIQAAAAAAVQNCLNDAGIVLLEPIMKLEVVTPDAFLGNIQADLNARRAIIVNSEVRGDLRVLEVESALSKMFGYSTQIRSLSQGRASYAMEPLKYAEAPPEVLEEMIG
jgi:elongation factor G